jgi:pimeloyl-ACP methyl ester carboxylesterase
MSAAGRGPFAELRNRHGERLEFAFHEAAPAAAGAGVGGPRSIAVLAHGVTSNMDRPYLVLLADALARAGIAALRFSFAGNGGSEGRFEEATLTKEVDDAASVVDLVSAAGFTRIAFAGHSMGGAVGLLLAVRDERVKALVSLAGMFHVARFFERHFGRLRFGEAMLGKTNCPWSRALAEDAARIGSLHEAAARVRVPWLLVHGDADEMVPLEDAKDARDVNLAKHAKYPKHPNAIELVELVGVDHRFTGAIPQMVAAVVPWVARVVHG